MLRVIHAELFLLRVYAQLSDQTSDADADERADDRDCDSYNYTQELYQELVRISEYKTVCVLNRRIYRCVGE